MAEICNLDWPDEAIAYAASVRPVYEIIQGALVQLAGLIILGTNRSRTGIEANGVLEQVVRRLKEANASLGISKPPTSLLHVHRSLVAAHRELELLVDKINRKGERRQTHEGCDFHLEKAYCLLKRGAIYELGLKPFDFSHACCAS